jgi:hypothetical protein
MISKKETQQNILKWLNNNRYSLSSYQKQYLALSEKGILAHSINLENVLENARQSNEYFVIYYVPGRSPSMMTILPVRIRSVSRHEWKPEYIVTLSNQDIAIEYIMLVDSGADFSVISKKAGIDLGFHLADAEQTLLAYGIGGTVEYVLRKVNVLINGIEFMMPVAWLQDNQINEMIIGREVVFEEFRIEFIQAEEKIQFREYVKSA